MQQGPGNMGPACLAASGKGNDIILVKVKTNLVKTFYDFGRPVISGRT